MSGRVPSSKSARGGARPANPPAEPSVPLSLRLAEARERPLTPGQKRFERLVRKVETLRAERKRMETRWEKFRAVYLERVLPEDGRMVERRRQVLRVLAAYWRAPKGLGARQRELLEDLLRRQMAALRESGPDAFDAELRKLWETLNPAEVEEPDADDENAAAADAGAEDDAKRSSASDAKKAAEEAEASAGASGSKEKDDESPAAKKAREDAERREVARKRTVVGIYKQLAKALHPDLEQDPVLRERKQTLMQELTKAHREGDLHTLLRLELEWIEREEGDLERLGDEKLGIYCELLEEQVEDLQAELREVAFEPRFAAMVRFMNPASGGPQEIEKILLSIRQMSDSLKRLRDALNGPDGRQALRSILEEVAEQRRREESFFGFGGETGPEF